MYTACILYSELTGLFKFDLVCRIYCLILPSILSVLGILFIKITINKQTLICKIIIFMIYKS